jgi:hypothetical protein
MNNIKKDLEEKRKDYPNLVKLALDGGKELCG